MKGGGGGVAFNGHGKSITMVIDSYSVRRFLVDTGAEVSVFTATTVDRNSPCQVTKLTTANRSNICTFGKRTIPLQFNMRHFKWTFTIAQVSPSLLGANFLSAHSLLIDIKGRSLIDSFDLTSITLRRIYAAVPHLGSIASAEEDFWGDYTLFSGNLHFFCTCHNFFLLSSVQILFIPACCLLCVL